MPTNTIQCPEGYKVRKGYTRKIRKNIANQGFTVRRKGQTYTAHPKEMEVYVPAHCIKVRTKKSTGIGKLRKGRLIKYGYQYRLADRIRHTALKKAIEVYGAKKVYQMLNEVAVLAMEKAPDAYDIFKKDRDWIREEYTKK